MKLETRLEDLIKRTDAVRLASYGDRTTGLVLQWKGKDAVPREELDHLGARAGACLSLAEGEAAAGQAAWVLCFSADDTEVFMGFPDEPEDFLALRALPGEDARPVIAEALAFAGSAGSKP